MRILVLSTIAILSTVGCSIPDMSGRLVSAGYVVLEDNQFALHVLCGSPVRSVRAVQFTSARDEQVERVVWAAQATPTSGVETVNLFASDQSGVVVSVTRPIEDGRDASVYLELIPATSARTFVLLPEDLRDGEAAWGDRRMTKQDVLDSSGSVFRC